MNLEQEERIEDYLNYKIKCIKDAIELNDLIFIEDNNRLFSTSDLFKIHYATSITIDINKAPYEIYRALFKSGYNPDVVIFYDEPEPDEPYEPHFYDDRYKRLVLNLIRMGIQVVMYDGFHKGYEFFKNKTVSFDVIRFENCFSKEAVKELDDYLLKKRLKMISRHIERLTNTDT
ncbi:TPA: hypothetical protein PJI95_004630 [Salmonella enterica subsp. enterica serovar Enteritidis]|uniref:Uncharacterized protein n=1 Tax=Salmonella enteritidis TaxID=149539 RepID=A0A704LCE8_SALEN|nr:hypothetical protein [Salmonella enterica subsp. enterica serovar Enteritidis]HAR8860272.1 hypothetical protein [Salmonella enterica]HAC8161968.1 hypothetical protein [Salmonella enterica subsp. enterica serovar Enteritidis]HDG6815281.1 hypothetical protein [Salmonella enterica subsp. enterica serovar Enteritidis]HDH0060611.1 hypothetical protein [Salmonella enterica subsp. enterica serovar Enteritidis]